MEFGVVSRITDGYFRYQAWPTVAKDEKGVIYVGSSSHRLGHVCPFGKNYLHISRDGGKTWEGPIIANDTCLDDRDGGVTAWGDGQLALTWFNPWKRLYNERMGKTPGLMTPLAKAVVDMWNEMPDEEYEDGSFIRFSEDGGKTWGKKVQVPVTAPHGPIRRRDGSLFYLGKEYLWRNEEECKGDHIYAYESRDGGQTWQQLCQVEFPEGLGPSNVHEPHAVELPDGTILGALRVGGPMLPQRNGVALTFSYDGGKTFTPPQIMDHSGTPPHLLLHSSGAVVLTYGRREAPCGERARISWDGGKTWGEELVISQEAPDWDLGYPSSVELEDGSILTVYYQKYPGDDYNSILYTKWELPKKI